MPSVLSTSKVLLGLLPAALALQQVPSKLLTPRQSSSPSSGSASSCPNPQLSCSTSGSVNTCCVQSPGGVLLQTQLWDTNPSTGPADSWTIHGLWPDLCSGSYQENCDSSRDYSSIQSILQQDGDNTLLNYMNTYWVSDDESNDDFWVHEWSTHGTCISTLDPSCFSDYTTGEEVPPFFQTVVNLFKTLPTYEWLSNAGITPGSSYSLSDIQSALSNQHGGDVYLGCQDGSLYEVYYYFNARGPVQNADFTAISAVGGTGNCPSTVTYAAKSQSSSSAQQ